MTDTRTSPSIHTRRKPGAVEVCRYDISKGAVSTERDMDNSTDGITNSLSAAPSLFTRNTYRGIPSGQSAFSIPILHSHQSMTGAPVFSTCDTAWNNPLYSLLGVVGPCVRAHNDRAATPFLQSEQTYYIIAPISELIILRAAATIAPCPFHNFSTHTIAYRQATPIRAARKSTDCLHTELAVFERHGGAAPRSGEPGASNRHRNIFREISHLIEQMRGSSEPKIATDRDCPFSITTPTSNPRQNGPVSRRNGVSLRQSYGRGCFFSQPLESGSIDNASRTPLARPTGRRRTLRTNEASLYIQNSSYTSTCPFFFEKPFCVIYGTANHEPELSLTTKPSITARQGREHRELTPQAPGPNIPGDRRSSTIASPRCQTDHLSAYPPFFRFQKAGAPKKNVIGLTT